MSLSDQVTNAALDFISRSVLGLAPAWIPELHMGIWTNLVPTTPDMTLAYLGESTDPLYERMKIRTELWNGVTNEGISYYKGQVCSFTFSEDDYYPDHAQGHFVIDVVSGNIWWALRWSDYAAGVIDFTNPLSILAQWDTVACIHGPG